MKYKAGDKVIVRKDLNKHDRYYMEDKRASNDAVEDMIALAGKVVCVSCENEDYTVGKVYEFIDGSIRDDKGNLRYTGDLRCKHPGEIVQLYKFIPLVE